MKIYNRSNKFFLVILSSLFIAFASLFFIGKSLSDFYEDEIEIYKKNLEHSTVQQSFTIENYLRHNMALLKGAANTFMFNEDLSNDEIIKITKNIQKLTEFDRVFLVKKNGEAVFSTGDIINISDRDYFKNITKAKNEIAETRDGS